MAGSIERRLYELAEDNFGFVTTRVAAAADIPAARLVQLAERGALARVSHGVYRLVRFPPSQFDPYMAAALWPAGVQGVLCHDTALDLYDVCDINPNLVHIVVPTSHRVRRTVPEQYVIHHDDLAPDDVTVVEGLPATTLARTIADCATAGVGTYLLEQAVASGAGKGLLTRAQASSAAELLHGIGARDD